jgi:acyl carrier protein
MGDLSSRTALPLGRKQTSMQDSEIYSTLTDVFRDTFDDETIVLSPDLRPETIPGWDSAHYITLVVATEVRFGLRFGPAELESLGTIGDFVTRISDKLSRSPARAKGA